MSVGIIGYATSFKMAVSNNSNKLKMPFKNSLVTVWLQLGKFKIEVNSNINICIFDLRLLEKPIEPSVVHFSMDHAKWLDVKQLTLSEIWLDAAIFVMTSPLLTYPNIIHLLLMQPVMWSSLQGMRE